MVKRRTRQSMGKCAKCGETNHVTVDELHITVATQSVSTVCVSETWFKDYMDSSSLQLLCKGFDWRGKIGVMDEPVV